MKLAGGTAVARGERRHAEAGTGEVGPSSLLPAHSPACQSGRLQNSPECLLLCLCQGVARLSLDGSGVGL